MDQRPILGEKCKEEKPTGMFHTHVGVSRSAQDLVELGWEVILSPSVGRNVIGRVLAEVAVCVVRTARRLLLRAAGVVAQVGFGPTLAWLLTLCDCCSSSIMAFHGFSSRPDNKGSLSGYWRTGEMTTHFAA